MSDTPSTVPVNLLVHVTEGSVRHAEIYRRGPIAVPADQLDDLSRNVVLLCDLFNDPAIDAALLEVSITGSEGGGDSVPLYPPPRLHVDPHLRGAFLAAVGALLDPYHAAAQFTCQAPPTAAPRDE